MLSGGKAGFGSENKVPFVAVFELNDEGRPFRLKMDRSSGFTREAIKVWTGKRVYMEACLF